MADAHFQRPDPREDGYLRACEGILRSHYGRRPCSAAARAIEQLAREATGAGGQRHPTPVPWGQAVLAWLRGHSLAWGSAVTAVALAVGFSLYIYRPALQPLEIGTIAHAIGAPNLRQGTHGSPRSTNPGSKVYLGDRIETGDADKVELAFKDGTTLRLNFNTVVEIPKSVVAKDAAKSSLVRPPQINLLRGQVWTKVQKLTNAPQYAIHTEPATAIARGTEFGVKLLRASARSSPLSTPNPQLSASPTAVLTVKEGVVDFTNALGSVQATAMTESTARADTKPSEPKRLTELWPLGSSQGRNLLILTSPLSGVESGERLVPGGGWAGLTLRDVPGNHGTSNAPPSQSAGTVLAVQVSRQSPAEMAGIQVGDRILAIENQQVTTAAQADQLIVVRPNSEVALHLRRADQELKVTLSAVNRSSLVPGPTLSLPEQERLREVTQRFTRPGDRAPEELLRLLPDDRLRAAGDNNLGVILEIGDQLGPAIRAYGRAARLAPAVALYRFNLGLALRKIGSFERAAEELAAAADLAPDSAAARLRFAEVCSLLGRNPEALELTETALQAFPQSHGLWELKAQLLWREGRLNEAREAAAQAIDLDPDCMVGHSYLAGVLQDLGELEQAEAAYLKALALDPQQSLLYRRIGNLRQERGDLAGAEASLRRSLELNPDDPMAHGGLAFVFEDLGRTDEAVTHYRKAIALDPQNLMSLHNLAEICRKQGNHLAEAEALYRRAIESAPDHADSLSGLGMLLALQGELEEAEQLARRAQQLEPSSSSIQNNLGEVLRLAGHVEEAAACYRKAIQLNPDNLAPYNNLGVTLATRRQFAEAERVFRALAERAPTPGRLTNLAKVCEEGGKLVDAEAFYRAALEMRPEDPSLAARLALFLSNHRLNLDEALSLARHAAQANPSSAEFLNTLGWVHFQRHELALAEETLKTALALAGDTPTAAAIREDLEKVTAKRSGKPQ